jgi:hypothetical protein
LIFASFKFCPTIDVSTLVYFNFLHGKFCKYKFDARVCVKLTKISGSWGEVDAP